MPNSEPNNQDRAGWAEAGVEAFAKLTMPEEEPIVLKLTDLLCNLRHLCDREALDFDDLMRVADFHYESEIEEQGLLNPKARRRSWIEASGLDKTLKEARPDSEMNDATWIMTIYQDEGGTVQTHAGSEGDFAEVSKGEEYEILFKFKFQGEIIEELDI